MRVEGASYPSIGGGLFGGDYGGRCPGVLKFWLLSYFTSKAKDCSHL